MKFDKGDRTYDKEVFEYVDDPTIESVESGVTTGQVNVILESSLLNSICVFIFWHCSL